MRGVAVRLKIGKEVLSIIRRRRKGRSLKRPVVFGDPDGKGGEASGYKACCGILTARSCGWGSPFSPTGLPPLRLWM